MENTPPGAASQALAPCFLSGARGSPGELGGGMFLSFRCPQYSHSPSCIFCQENPLKELTRGVRCTSLVSLCAPHHDCRQGQAPSPTKVKTPLGLGIYWAGICTSVPSLCLNCCTQFSLCLNCSLARAHTHTPVPLRSLVAKSRIWPMCFWSERDKRQQKTDPWTHHESICSEHHTAKSLV